LKAKRNENYIRIITEYGRFIDTIIFKNTRPGRITTVADVKVGAGPLTTPPATPRMLDPHIKYKSLKKFIQYHMKILILWLILLFIPLVPALLCLAAVIYIRASGIVLLP
jgi:hypothetical protein